MATAKEKKPKLKDVKAEKKTKPSAPAAGHNSGVNPRMQDIVQEILDNNKRVAELNKANRELRNEAKTSFGVLAGPLSHEIRLRKMDDDVRIQFESGHHDLKDMLGYQASLDLAPGTVARTEEEYVDPSDPSAAANKLLGRH